MKTKGEELRLETNWVEIFWQWERRWGDESWEADGEIGGRKTGRWLLVPLLFSNCLAAFCCLGPRTPCRFSSAESHETGSSGIVSVRSATGELTQMLLFSLGGTTDNWFYISSHVSLHMAEGIINDSDQTPTEEPTSGRWQQAQKE